MQVLVADINIGYEDIVNTQVIFLANFIKRCCFLLYGYVNAIHHFRKC